jgi:hypothetical protein
MEFLEEIKRVVNSRFTELKDYTETFNKEVAKKREDVILQAKEKMKENPDSVNLEEIAYETMFLTGFHQTDIRKLQEQLLMAYDLYRELGGEEKFETDLEEAVQFLRVNLPKRIFVAKNGKFEEIEEGYLDKMKTNYKSQNYYKMFEGPLKQILSE